MLNPFVPWQGLTMWQAITECASEGRGVSFLFDGQDRRIARSTDPVAYANHSDKASDKASAHPKGGFYLPDDFVAQVEAAAIVDQATAACLGISPGPVSVTMSEPLTGGLAETIRAAVTAQIQRERRPGAYAPTSFDPLNVVPIRSDRVIPESVTAPAMNGYGARNWAPLPENESALLTSIEAAIKSMPRKLERLLYADTQAELDDMVVAAALAILQDRCRPGVFYDSPQQVKDMLTVAYSDKENEIFSVTFLDAQHRLIQHMDMFVGTLSQTSVYPREVVKAALRLNAGSVIFCHNHPSGDPEPSRADEHLTHSLKSALSVVDVRVLDHVIVAGGKCVSFAERGLI